MILKNNKRIDGCSDTVPIGTLNPFLGSTAPYGYLLCQGQKVSKTTYKELYEICGNTFGQSTDTEFYLPDLRGQTIAGYKEGDSTFGTLGGLIGSLTHLHSTGNHTLTIDEIPRHNHSYNYNAQTTDISTMAIRLTSNSKVNGYTGTEDGYSGGSQPHNHGDTSPNSSLQPTIVLNWIVKAFQLMPNQSYVENSLESDSTINSLSAAKGKELNEKIIGSKSNIQVGDNLEGQTIYFYFPPDMEEIAEDYSPIIESYDSDTGTTELLLYQAITSEIRIRYIYSDGTIQTVTKDLVMGDWSGSFTMGGIVTSIDTSCPLYNYFYLKNIGLEDRVKTLEEGENCSTNEQRIGIWVDGKPLYRKVITYNGSSLGEKGTEKRYTIPHGISNLNTIKSIKFSATSTSGSVIYTLPYINEDTQGLIKTSIDLYDKQNLTLTVLNDTWKTLSLEIVLEYTKTTD